MRSDERSKKWLNVFSEAGVELKPGVYVPSGFDQKIGPLARGIVIHDERIRESYEEHIYRLSVRVHSGTEPKRVNIITDSVETLKVLSNREFPLGDFAVALLLIEKETVFDGGLLAPDGSLTVQGNSLRVVPRTELSTFEVRFIK